MTSFAPFCLCFGAVLFLLVAYQSFSLFACAEFQLHHLPRATLDVATRDATSWREGRMKMTKTTGKRQEDWSTVPPCRGRPRPIPRLLSRSTCYCLQHPPTLARLVHSDVWPRRGRRQDRKGKMWSLCSSLTLLTHYITWDTFGVWHKKRMRETKGIAVCTAIQSSPLTATSPTVKANASVSQRLGGRPS